jgi:hypothetical protein
MTVCLDLYQTFLSISFETLWERFPFDTFVSVGTYLLDFPFFKNFSLWELRISFLKNPFGIPQLLCSLLDCFKVLVFTLSFCLGAI